MDALTFLDLLFGDSVSDQAQIVIWEPNGKRPTWCSSTKQAVERARKRHEEADIYFSVCLHDQKVSRAEADEAKAADPKKSGADFARGCARSAVVMGGIWIDIDVRNDHHSKVGLAQTLDQCVSGVMGLTMKPSIIVTTGGGIHAYWLFKEPWTLESNAERERAQALCEGFQKWVANTCGFAVDATYDLARVLRLPATINHKYRRVATGSMPHTPEPRYNPSDFDDFSAKPRSISKVVVTTPLNIDLEAQVPDKIGILLANDTAFSDVWHGRKKFPSPSERDMSIAARLVRYEGWEDQEICDALIANRRVHGASLDRADFRVEKLQYTIAKARKNYLDQKKAEESDEIAKEMAAQERAELLKEFLRLKQVLPEQPVSVVHAVESGVAGVQAAPEVVAITPEAQAAQQVRNPLVAQLNEALGLPVTKAVQRLIRFEGDEGSYILVVGGAQVKLGGIENLHNPDKFAMRLADGADTTPAIVTRNEWREQWLPILLGIVEHMRLGSGGSLAETMEQLVLRYTDQGIQKTTKGLLSDLPVEHNGEIYGTAEGLYKVASASLTTSTTFRSHRVLAENLRRLGSICVKMSIRKDDGKVTSRSAWKLTTGGLVTFVAGSNEHGRLTDVVKEEVKPDLDVPEGEAPF
jgi:hypothetical protein